MMGRAHDRLRTGYAQIVARLGTPGGRYPLHFSRQDDGSRHYERRGDGWLAITTERGAESQRIPLPTEADALFLLASDLTFGLAVDFELAHRVDDADGRRTIAAYQAELMGKLSPEWRARIEREWAATLQDFPLRDPKPRDGR